MSLEMMPQQQLPNLPTGNQHPSTPVRSEEEKEQNGRLGTPPVVFTEEEKKERLREQKRIRSKLWRTKQKEECESDPIKKQRLLEQNRIRKQRYREKKKEQEEDGGTDPPIVEEPANPLGHPPVISSEEEKKKRKRVWMRGYRAKQKEDCENDPVKKERLLEQSRIRNQRYRDRQKQQQQQLTQPAKFTEEERMQNRLVSLTDQTALTDDEKKEQYREKKRIRSKLWRSKQKEECENDPIKKQRLLEQNRIRKQRYREKKRHEHPAQVAKVTEEEMQNRSVSLTAQTVLSDEEKKEQFREKKRLSSKLWRAKQKEECENDPIKKQKILDQSRIRNQRYREKKKQVQENKGMSPPLSVKSPTPTEEEMQNRPVSLTAQALLTDEEKKERYREKKRLSSKVWRAKQKEEFENDPIKRQKMLEQSRIRNQRYRQKKKQQPPAQPAKLTEDEMQNRPVSLTTRTILSDEDKKEHHRENKRLSSKVWRAKQKEECEIDPIKKQKMLEQSRIRNQRYREKKREQQDNEEINTPISVNKSPTLTEEAMQSRLDPSPIVLPEEERTNHDGNKIGAAQNDGEPRQDISRKEEEMQNRLDPPPAVLSEREVRNNNGNKTGVAQNDGEPRHDVSHNKEEIDKIGLAQKDGEPRQDVSRSE